MKKVIFLILLPVTLLAQKNDCQIPDQCMQMQLKVNDYTEGILVMKQNKVLLEKACCFSKHKWRIQNSVQTRFPIGSITNQFTAVCILQLAEQGKLALNDKISKFFPDFPKADSITICMLLNHTSGIAYSSGQPEFTDAERFLWNKDSIIAIFKNKPYNFSPGSKRSYSNSEYFLLGYNIEKVSGQFYNEYLCENIFKDQNIYKSLNSEWTNMGWLFNGGSAISPNVEGIYKLNWGWYQALKGMSIPF